MNGPLDEHVSDAQTANTWGNGGLMEESLAHRAHTDDGQANRFFERWIA